MYKKTKEHALAVAIDRKEERIKLHMLNSLCWKCHLGFSLNNNDDDDGEDHIDDEFIRDNLQSSGIEHDDV